MFGADIVVASVRRLSVLNASSTSQSRFNSNEKVYFMSIIHYRTLHNEINPILLEMVPSVDADPHCLLILKVLSCNL